MGETADPAAAEVRDILEDQFDDAVYTVEEGVVWVSGINARCHSIARQMAMTLSHGYDIPTNLVHGDGAAEFGGMQFEWGAAA
jgi:D-arabinose 5-phosphate isomerase GutQ